MQSEFKEILTKFYDIATEKKQLSDVFKHALQRYLNYVELQQQKIKEKDRDSQQIKSFKSGTSSYSADGFAKIKKLFHSTHLETTLFFSYFLQIIKNKKPQFLAFVLQKVSERLLTVRKRITNDQKKKFETKFNRLYDQLKFLSDRTKGNMKVDWVYFEVFTQFESECLLLAQMLSSINEELQSLQNIKANEYATLCLLLKIKCHLFDKKTKQFKIFGSGQIKLYIGKKGEESYCILTQKQFELQLRLNKKERPQTYKQIQGEQKGIKELKKYPTIKFKQQFLTEMLKLKQDYEINTNKIASLFNFKDSVDGSKPVDQNRQA